MKRLAALALAAAEMYGQTLGTAPNSVRTVLTANVGIADTTVSVAVCSKITNGSILNIDQEMLLSTGVSGSCVVTVQRAYLGTTAGRHYTNGTVAAYLTDLTTNASSISSGTLAAARGGAGNINGILKADGTGLVSQAIAGTDYLTTVGGSVGQALTASGSGGFGTPVTLAPSATTDTTNAANISSGTLNASRLPATAALTDLSNIGTILHDMIFTDGTYDIGKSGATRPRDLFTSRNGNFGGTLTATGHTTFEGVTSTGATGTGKLVYHIAPAFTGLTSSAGAVDFSASTHTLPVLKGTAAGKPGTCTQGEVYFATDVTAGVNLYYCTTTNAWTQQIAGGSGNPPGGSNGQIQYNNAGTSFGGFTVTGDGALPSSGVLTVSRVNGTSIPTNAAADQVVVTTASATGSWAALPACLDTNGNHLNYNTSTHLFSCGTSAGLMFVTSQTTTYSVLAANGPSQLIKADATGGTFNVVLFTAVGNAGYTVVVKKADGSGNAVMITTTASQTIDGAANQTDARQYDSLTLVSDGANWLII